MRRATFSRDAGEENSRIARRYASATNLVMTTDLLFALAIGYALGSIPFGLLVTRLGGKGDVRSIGSGNIGATNVLRTGSKGLAAATLLLDALKGTAAVLIARALFDGAETYAAAGALIGHLYPVWLRFRGGKGVATLLGILIALLPAAAAIFVIVWLAVLAITRFSSLSGIIAALSAPVSAALLGEELLFPALVGFALLVVWKHRANIARLAAGKEPRVGRSRA